MNLRVATMVLVTELAVLVAPAGAGAQPATHSLLDPVRLAADFAPGTPPPPALAVRPFEVPAVEAEPATSDSVAAPGDSLASAMPPLASSSSIGVEEQPPIVGPVVGALVGGAVGLYAGGALGLALFGGDEYSSDDYADIAAVVLGATVGEILLMPAGAHLANGSRGSYWSALGGSALGGLATIALGAIGPAGAIIGLGIQVALTVSAERRSARHKAVERAAQATGEAPAP